MSGLTSAVVICAALLGPISTDCPPPVVASACVHGVPLVVSCAKCGSPEELPAPCKCAVEPACCCDSGELVRRLNEITGAVNQIEGSVRKIEQHQNAPPALGVKFALQQVSNFHQRLDEIRSIVRNELDAARKRDEADQLRQKEFRDQAAAWLVLYKSDRKLYERRWSLVDADLAKLTPLAVSAIAILIAVLGCVIADLVSRCKGRPYLLVPLLLAGLVGSALANESAAWRVQVEQADGTAYGSATAIAEHYLLTNSHVVGGTTQASVEVYQPHTGARLAAQVVGVDPGEDLALLYVAQSVPYVRIASEAPQSGSSAVVYGFGKQGILRRGEGVISEAGVTRENGTPQATTTCLIESGDSGSGVLNAAGELVAVNWGNDSGDVPSQSVAVPLAAIHKFVLGYETQCLGGGCEISGGCWNGQCRPQRPSRPPGGGQMIPMPSRPPAPVTPVTPTQPANGCTCGDLSKLFAEVNARIDALVVRIDAFGSACPPCQPAQPGPIGPPGPKGDEEADASVIERVIRSKLGVEVTNRSRGATFYHLGVCAVGLVAAAFVWKGFK